MVVRLLAESRQRTPLMFHILLQGVNLCKRTANNTASRLSTTLPVGSALTSVAHLTEPVSIVPTPLGQQQSLLG